MPEQLHESGKADAQTEHFSGKGMAELVAGYGMGASGAFSSQSQLLAKSPIEGLGGGRARQQEGGRDWRLGAGMELPQALEASDEAADIVIGGNEAFGI
jgi:hypothetical protein